MSGNELHANLTALLNGDDPETGKPVDFDDDETVLAECSPADGMAGVLHDGSPQRFKVVGFRVNEAGALVLELEEEEPTS